MTCGSTRTGRVTPISRLVVAFTTIIFASAALTESARAETMCVSDRFGVSHMQQLVEAIECFNASPAGTTTTVVIRHDVHLSASLPAIDNPAVGTSLRIEGPRPSPDPLSLPSERGVIIAEDSAAFDSEHRLVQIMPNTSVWVHDVEIAPSCGCTVIDNRGHLKTTSVLIRGYDAGVWLRGGIENHESATLVVENSRIDRLGIRQAPAIKNFGFAIVRDSALSHITSEQDTGGAAIQNHGNLVVERTTIAHNHALQEEGGGISIRSGGTAQVRDSVLIENKAPTGGGIYVEEGASLRIERSAILANVGGPAIFSLGVLEVSNSTISGNSGGIRQTQYSSDSTASIDFTTITKNADVGLDIRVGFGLDSSSWQRSTVAASIITDADDSVSAAIAAVPDRLDSGGGNIVQGSSLGFQPSDDLLVANALVGDLGDHGGPTPTHRLIGGSPAIRNVDPSIAPLIDRDQRGIERATFERRTSGSFEGLPTFATVRPARFADTRQDGATLDGRFRDTGRLRGGTVLEIQIAGRGEIPDTSKAVIMNLTAVDGTDPGYLAAYPCSDRDRQTSSVNYQQNSFDTNEIIVRLSPDGTVCVFALTDVHAIVDVTGYVGQHSPYVAINPLRVADSRDEQKLTDHEVGIRAAGTVWRVRPPTLAFGPVRHAFAVNLTATGSTAAGYATLFPCGQPVPSTSTVNFAAGATVANESLVKVDTSQICVYVSTDVHIILDIAGYVERSTSYFAISPERLVDTRTSGQGIYVGDGRFTPGTTRSYQATFHSEVPSDAIGVVANLTVTGASAPGYISAFSCDDELPPTSSVNYTETTTRANEVIVRLSADRQLCVFSLAPVHVIVDVVGYLTPG